MASTEDLRAALRAQADNAPSVADVLSVLPADGTPAGARTQPPWRRRGVLGVAAATVAAAIAVPALVVSAQPGGVRLLGGTELAGFATESAARLSSVRAHPGTGSGPAALTPSSSVGPGRPGVPGAPHRTRGPTGASRPGNTATATATATATGGPSGLGTATATPTRPGATADPTASGPAPRATSGGSRGPAGPSAATTLRYSFQVNPIDGYSIVHAGVLPTAQYADVVLPGDDTPVGSISVYAAGAFDPAAAEQGQPVQVGGLDGFYATIADQRIGAPAGAQQPAVVWPYAGGTWAVVQGDWGDRVTHGTWTGDPVAAELAVASAVDTTTSAPLPIPVRVAYLPPGTVAESAVTGTSPLAVIGLSDGGPSNADVPQAPGHGSSMQITAAGFDPETDLRQVDAQGNLRVPGGPDVHLGAPVDVVGARAFQSAEGDVTAVYPDRVMTVRFTGFGTYRYSPAQLLAVAQGLVLSSSTTDQTTWFDASTAIG